MKTRVQRWGNSLAVRIPKAFAEEIGLREDLQVDMRLTEGTLVLEPCAPARLELEELLAGITEDNIHEAVDWGPAVGREIL